MFRNVFNFVYLLGNLNILPTVGRTYVLNSTISALAVSDDLRHSRSTTIESDIEQDWELLADGILIDTG